jgi:uncharacterized membrane protein
VQSTFPLQQTLVTQSAPLSYTPSVSSLSLSPFESETLATYRKNIIFHEIIKDLSFRDKRKVFADMRNASINVTVDTLFPNYGFTVGDFSTLLMLSGGCRKKK